MQNTSQDNMMNFEKAEDLSVRNLIIKMQFQKELKPRGRRKKKSSDHI